MISSSLMRMRGGFIIQEGFVSRFRDGKAKGEGGAAVLSDFQRAANLAGQVADHAQAQRARLVPVEPRGQSDAVVLHRKRQLAGGRRSGKACLSALLTSSLIMRPAGMAVSSSSRTLSASVKTWTWAAAWG